MDAMIRALEGPERPGQEPHPSRHQWDLFALSALSGSEHTKLEEHLATCDACQESVGLINNEREAWDQSPTKVVMWREIDARIQEPPTIWDRLTVLMRSSLLAPIVPLGVFALVLGTTFFQKYTGAGIEPQGSTQQPGIVAVGPRTSPGPGIRKKGVLIPPDFHTYLHRKGVSKALGAKHQLTGGDILGFTYNARDFRYLSVILIDRKGEISWLYPGKSAPSIEIASHGRLKGSVQLDSAQGPERLLAFFSAQPLTPQEIKKLLAKSTKRDGLLTLPHQPAQTIYLRQRTLYKR